MKRTLVLLLITILTKIIAFSSNISEITNQDSTVCITSSNLKYANLIFLEHQTLFKENSLLKLQLKNYEELNNNLMQTDSLRLKQIQEYNSLDMVRINQINSLEKNIKDKNKIIKYWQIGGITVSAGLILFMILK
jgi:hypothetical protein